MVEKKGFTLIEILVVVSIIAILSLIALATFSSIQKGSRDAKRKSDLALVQSALEQYHADLGYYPNDISFSSGVSIASSPTRVYLQRVPLDPTGVVEYEYMSYNSGSMTTLCSVIDPTTCVAYCLFAKMENSSNAGGSAPCGFGPSYDYKVSSP